MRRRHLPRRLRRRRVDDSGVSMLITLAFVLFVSLVATAIVSQSGVSVRGAVATKDRANATYDAADAMQIGINQVRNSTFGNDPNVNGGQCDLAPSDANARALAFPGPNLGRNVAVTCDGGPGTGIAGGLVPVTSSNKPGAALLTLGTDPTEPGLTVSGNNVLGIKGRVYLNSGSDIPNVNTSVVVSNAGFTAKAPCAGSGTITSTPTAVCNATADTDPIRIDPGITYPTAYALPTAGLTYRQVPSTCPGGATYTFQPGYYDDAAALTNLFACNTITTFWFPPDAGGRGVYYFDFHNGPTDDPGGALNGSSHVWTINDQNVRAVGGTPQGWSIGSPGTLAIPGACVSPLTSTTANGVAFVFGGDSRLNISAGKMEVCGQWYIDKPPIAVYGAKTDVQPDAVTGPETEKSAGNGINSGAVNFTGLDQIRETDGGANQYAAATVGGNGNGGGKDATVTVTGYAPITPIPAGSLLTKAELVVVHREVPKTLGTDKLQNQVTRVTVTPAGGTAFSPIAVPEADVAANGSWTTAQSSGVPALDITTALAPLVHASGFTGMSVAYAAAVTGNDQVDVHLDSIQLKLTWKRPGLRAQSGCVTAVNGCAMILTTNTKTDIFFQGTAYIPRALADVTLNNVSAQVFRSGLVARALHLTFTGSTPPGKPVIELPDNAFGPSPTDVYFKSYVCPEGATCPTPDNGVPPAPWKLAATARVGFEDIDTQVPQAGNRRVSIKSWTILR